MRCPSCGAHNSAAADWCTQCYTDLRPALPPAPAGSGRPDAPEPGPDEPAPPHRPPAPGAGRAVVTDGGAEFRRTDDGLQWSCRFCGTWNHIDLSTCPVCNQPLSRTMDAGADQGPAPAPRLSESSALVASALLPGLAHLLIGRHATGLARSILYLVWLVGGAALLRAALSSDQSILPALPLLGGALVLWLATLADAVVAVRGTGTELLRPRVFLWLVVAVLGTVMAAFVIATLQLPSAPAS